ncbi:hypothetical protein RMB03_02615 [Acinetobacter sp. V91_7]|uniref:hypothetical protein n=1 Tax=unclassified Acinetobacter TaxID=196816 RepID=UPI00287D465B|nr:MULTISPECIES: hypothetical protein [unclassified Acinetobacter]MDS7932886.1 hypothetical protein [Acinetobacter sp. V91_4B]MDS7961853.1 hypothetical protein [Acinetobacter sp. V91_7]MDS8028926.1 hypothetical protein [Acinetobacter sp. V91_13]
MAAFSCWGKPRPSHVAAHGKTFDVVKGMYSHGQWVKPGQLNYCRCGSKAIIDETSFL